MSAPNIIYPPSSGGGGGTITGSGGSQYVAVWSGTSTLTTGSLTDTGSRVGISQTSPVTTFQVGGNTVATASPVGAFCTLGSDSRFTADDGTRAVTLAANGTNAIVGTTTAHDLLVQRAGVTAATIKAGSIATLTGATPAATNGNYANLALTGGTGTGATADIVVTSGAVSSVTIRAPGNGYTAGDLLTCPTLTGLGAGVTVATVATVILEIEGAANIMTSGRLAAGTTNGTEQLTVSAGSVDRIGMNVVGSVSTLTFGSTNSTGAIRTIAYDRGGASWTFNYGNNPGPLSTALTIDNSGVSTFGAAVRATGTTQTTPAFSRHDSTTSGIYFPGVNEIGFTISNQHAMYISTGRNIGVGTTSPVAPMHVLGTSITSASTTTASAGTLRIAGSATNALFVGSFSDSPFGMCLQTNSTSYPLILQPAGGSVGVNVTSPTTNTLDVSTAGWGIKLNGSPSNINGNTLDCYEEGTWTPIDRSGAGLTFTAVSGTYTRVGRTVTAQCTLTYPSTANASDASFSLPIAMTTANTNFGGATIGSVGTLVKNNVTALIKTGATPATDHRIALITYNGAGTVTNANMSLVTIVVSVCYNVA